LIRLTLVGNTRWILGVVTVVVDYIIDDLGWSKARFKGCLD
jgi:hypothetical protein